MSATASSVDGSLSEANSDSGKISVLHRLFVGYIPKTATEKDLTPLFNTYGKVRDIILLRDRSSGVPRGCAFVSYATQQEAGAAISALDKKVVLPGASAALEVRYAKSHQYVKAGAGPEDNRQLFFTAAPTEFAEQDITSFFSQFGPVEEVNLFRGRKSGQSKRCGFITFQDRIYAVRAMEVLENQCIEPPQEMAVQWADPELQLKKKKALEESNADNRMLFFAKVLRSATEEDVKAVFSKFGKVYDVNLFRAFQGAPTTKGCGLITMGTHEEANAAIEGLDSVFTWEGLDSPMVVKWMDAALQRRRREQHLAAMRQGLLPGMQSAAGPADGWMQQGVSLGGLPTVAGRGALAPALILADQEIAEAPPAGCAPDAIKLFVGNVPRACTEDQLLPFFETVGKVAELVIVRDKATRQSKGSAFVWYQQRAHAERAILQFNLRHILPDPAGEQDRPLVVRKARARPAKPRPFSFGAPGQQAVSVLGAGPTIMNVTSSSQPAFYTTLSNSNHMQQTGLVQNHLVGTNFDGLQHQALPSQTIIQPGGGNNYVQVTGPSGGLIQQAGYRTVQPYHGAQLVSIQTAPNVSEAGLYEAYGGGSLGDVQPVERYMLANHGSGSSGIQTAGPASAGNLDNISPIALSVPLNMQQFNLINSHLYSVQSMSGAQINVSPGAPGVFHLLVSGTKSQVENAKQLMSSILGKPIV